MQQLQTMERSNPPVPYHTVRRASVKGRFCACGNPALRFKHSEYVCERCDNLEASLYSRFMGRVKAPEQQTVIMPQAEPKERRFKAFIRQFGNEFVVSGHGEYHLHI